MDQQIVRRYGIRDPRHFVTDHKLACDTLISNTLKEHKSDFHGRTRFSPQAPKMGPSLKIDSICHDIKLVALPPAHQVKQRHKSWILDASLQIVD